MFDLVDEYQDLNKAEQAVVDLLTGDGHVCIVGDDDQSLYSFKHAHPAGIREFHVAHDPTADHEILECRRCPTRVVAMANALIAHNRDREPRQLAPRAENGAADVTIIQYASLADEAAGIAHFAADLVNNQGYAPQDILILAQRRSVGNPIHDALTGLNVPSKSYYQEGVLDNASAQERLAILKLFIDPQDRIALRWLLGYGSNDFRSGAYARLREYCEQNGAEPWDTMVRLSNGEIRIAHTQHLVTRFREIQTELDALAGHAELQNFIPAWIEIDENDPFHRLVLDIAPNVEAPDELLGAVIEAVAQPDVPPDMTEVRVMSLHKSKGLREALINAAMGSFAAKANVFLVKAASHSGGRERMA